MLPFCLVGTACRNDSDHLDFFVKPNRVCHQQQRQTTSDTNGLLAAFPVFDPVLPCPRELVIKYMFCQIKRDSVIFLI